MPGAAWIVAPDLLRGRERGADDRRAARRRSRPARASSSSTTPRPTAPARSPTGSPPPTRDVAVLHRAGKQGLGPAYVAGFAHALAHGAGASSEMDCDFSHDPAIVPALLGALDDGADLALGSRYVAGGRGGELDRLAPGRLARRLRATRSPCCACRSAT